MKLPALLLLGSMIAAASLSAQTSVQTVTFDQSTTFTAASGSVQLVDSSFFTGSFNPFNSALGTLDSFEIEWTLANTGTGNFGASGGSISESVSGQLTLNGSIYHAGVLGANGTGGGPNGTIALSAPIGETDTFLVSGAGTDYAAAYLTAVTGTDPFTLAFTAPVNFSISSGTATFDAATSGSVKLTYHYTAAAVPEPATYAAIAGLLVLGLALWHRRRAAA